MPNPSKIVVLIADDEPSTLAMLASHLRSSGYSVLEASDGDQAWELAHEHLPHLVILDVMMPGMSGWEVCRKIREAVSLAHTGVIMLTGIGESLNEMTSPLYGADAHLDKPFEFTTLDARIKETLERRKQGALGRPDGGAEEASMAIEAGDLPAASAPAKKVKAATPKTNVPKPLAKTKPKAEPKAKTKPAPRKADDRPAKKPAPSKAAAPRKGVAPKKVAPVAKAPVKKAPVAKAPVKKAPVAKAPVGKTAATKAPVKAAAKKAPAKGKQFAPAKAAPVKKPSAPSKGAPKKAPGKPAKAPAKKAPVTKKAGAPGKQPAKQVPAKKAAQSVKVPPKKSAGAKKPGKKK